MQLFSSQNIISKNESDDAIRNDSLGAHSLPGFFDKKKLIGRQVVIHGRANCLVTKKCDHIVPADRPVLADSLPLGSIQQRVLSFFPLLLSSGIVVLLHTLEFGLTVLVQHVDGSQQTFLSYFGKYSSSYFNVFIQRC